MPNETHKGLKAVAAVVLIGAVIVGATELALAAISPSRNAPDYGAAIQSTGSVSGAAFTTIPPTGDPAAVADTQLAGFPLEGSTYAILTTGDAKVAQAADQSQSADANDGGGNVRGDTDYDVSVLRLDVQVPDGANCLSIDFKFLTEESTGSTNSFNDAFIAELDTSDWTTSGSTIRAPNNFAFDPSGQEISVNATGATSVSAGNAAGTVYDVATPLLRASKATTPGAHSLYLSIFDQGDAIVDSAVFVDQLSLTNRPDRDCTSGARPDSDAPSISLDTPADESTTTSSNPTFSGTAGTATGDSPQVTVKIYRGREASGTPVQTLTTSRTDSGTYSVDAASALAPDTYAAQAEQRDDSGNTGSSPPRRFTVSSSGGTTGTTGTTGTVIVKPPPPPPEVARSANVEPVQGTVRIRLRGSGQFVDLKDLSSIPIGSEIDAKAGIVKLTTAADSRGKMQSANFSLGRFVIAQRGGRDKTTELKLSGGSFKGCPGPRGTAKAGAARSRRSSVRKLFGNGGGGFRTRGRNSAATVRGTAWTTDDRCDGTFTRVQRGEVAVRDLVLGKTVTVKAGNSYLALTKAERRARRQSSRRGSGRRSAG